MTFGHLPSLKIDSVVAQKFMLNSIQDKNAKCHNCPFQMPFHMYVFMIKIFRFENFDTGVDLLSTHLSCYSSNYLIYLRPM